MYWRPLWKSKSRRLFIKNLYLVRSRRSNVFWFRLFVKQTINKMTHLKYDSGPGAADMYRCIVCMSVIQMGYTRYIYIDSSANTFLNVRE